MWLSTTRVYPREDRRPSSPEGSTGGHGASCLQCISGCLSRLQLPTAEQAELPIYLMSLLPAPIRTEVPYFDGNTFNPEHLLQMVPSVYPMGTATTLPPFPGCFPPCPVPVVEGSPAEQWEVENQLHLCYTEAEVSLMGTMAPGKEVVHWLRDTLGQ